MLVFLAKQRPVDFSDPDAEVLDNVYLLLSQAPNLHHIYPQHFLEGVKELSKTAPIDSLMNICYLRAKTNIRIGDKNPLHYFKDFKGDFERNFKKVGSFDDILRSHLIPKEFVEKEEFKPKDYEDFLYTRAEWFCQKLKDELPNVEVEIVN